MAEQLRLLSGATALQTEAIDLQQEGQAWAQGFQLFQQVGKVADVENQKQKNIR